MLIDLQFDEKTKKNTLVKSMNIAVQCSYYIFVDDTKIGQTPIYLVPGLPFCDSCIMT